MVVDKDVVGALVVVTGFASEGVKTQSSNSLNSTNLLQQNLDAYRFVELQIGTEI